MAKKEMTMERYEEIKRLLDLKVSVRDIARTMKCTRRTIRQIRDGIRPEPGHEQAAACPIWAEQTDWKGVLNEVIDGHDLKLCWEELAQDKVTYVNFWKQFHKRFPEYKKATVVHRVFEPGQCCEVDYAGKTIERVDLKTGQINNTPVFIGVLGFSQLIFACAREDATSRNFLDCHSKMYAYFGGVPKVTVPDCLKTGVIKCHTYDPDLNSSYMDLAKHFGTAIVPARPARPKDKPLVEGAVKIVMKYFRWIYRNHTFTSVDEINVALDKVIDRINRKPHSRFKVSRVERWEISEKPSLGPLPQKPYEFVRWREAKLHPDSHISVEKCLYSAPHIYRGRVLKVKLTDNFIEIFHCLERVALHKRSRAQDGRHITNIEHLPANARAYHEMTPKKLLSQAKYLSPSLHGLIEELFKENTLGHLRRAQGLVREGRKEIGALGQKRGLEAIAKAVGTMKAYDKIRVPYFRELLNRYRIEVNKETQEAQIKRKANNPMLRYAKAKS